MKKDGLVWEYGNRATFRKLLARHLDMNIREWFCKVDPTETLNFSPDAIEAQLGHRVPDRLGSAYNRTKHLEERWRMMQPWADYLDCLKRSGGPATGDSAL